MTVIFVVTDIIVMTEVTVIAFVDFFAVTHHDTAFEPSVKFALESADFVITSSVGITVVFIGVAPFMQEQHYCQHQ